MEWIRYANQGATRNQPLNSQLAQALSYLQDMGLTAEVFSGGQPAKGSGLARVGSVRHDHGNAADVFFYRGGERLDWSNPQHLPTFQEIVSRGRAAGLTGFGAGPGYMQPGSMHVGFGSPGVWGAGGRGANAPDWLRAAYEGAVAGNAPQMAAAPTPTAAPGAPASIASVYAQPTAPQAAPGGPPAMTPQAAMQAAGAPAAPQNFGQIALMFAQQQARRREERQAEEEAEQMRRAALFSPEGAASLYG